MQERISFADAAIREYFEKENNDQCPFIRDADRIHYSNAYRHLTLKTQVFPFKDYCRPVRGRMLHTQEVSRTARRIAEELGLCSNAAEAIASGHDLGHPAYGHAGEEAINQCMQQFGKNFNHDEQTARIVEKIEEIRPEFHGLNLTYLVRQAFTKRAERYNNSKSRLACDKKMLAITSLEGWIVFVVDKMIYTIHDIEDSYCVGHIKFNQLNEIPLIKELMPGILKRLGARISEVRLLLAYIKKEIYNRLLTSIYENSRQIRDYNIYKSHSFIMTDENMIGMSQNVANDFSNLRSWMFNNIYSGEPTKERDKEAIARITRLFELLYYEDDLMNLFNYNMLSVNSGQEREDIVRDLIVYSTEAFIDNFLREHDNDYFVKNFMKL